METKGRIRMMWGIVVGVVMLVMAVFLFAQEGAASGPAARSDKANSAVVKTCDGTGQVPVALPANVGAIRDDALMRAHTLMAAWLERNPDRAAAWREEEAAAMASHDASEEAPQATAPTPREKQPLKFTSRDKLIRNLALKKEINEGYRLFHSPTALGGTIGISCDMCHPDASNTHPETYPKFQMQLKKVALLRDMINWCIENPEKGKTLADDDARLRAVEAYIYAQRKGVALDYGKH